MVRDIKIIDIENQKETAWRKLKGDVLATCEIQTIRYKC